MAAATGTALLRSVATKAAVPLPPHFVLHGSRRPAPTGSRHPFSSSSHPTSVGNKDPSQNKNVFGQLLRAKIRSIPTSVKVFYFAAYASSFFHLFWVLPTMQAMHDELIDLRRERSILIEAAEECQRAHIKAQDVLIDSSQAQSTQALGQGKESDGHEAS